MSEPKILAACEAGGTKFICAVGTSADDMETARIETTTPDETMRQAMDFFHSAGATSSIEAIGVGTFGPINLNRSSEYFGYIEQTPKPGWSQFDMLGTFRSLGIPVRIDTDVNAACLAEAQHGAGRGMNTVLYITVGTGIGVGVVQTGKVLQGRTHPEIGHLVVSRPASDMSFDGTCPYHQNCVEGLACGPAIIKRWGKSLRHFTPDHPSFKLQSIYIGQLCANLVLTFSPDIIVIGGGVMGAKALLPQIRVHTRLQLGGYVAGLDTASQFDSLIVSPELGDRAGITGAFMLAEQVGKAKS